ncbi:MAG: hypothetical protein QOD93_7267 [Acetobacteraceae bacterium]|jgi:hypothetical protein|nr:hypothetical protein [Rhodopila sp.]MEA2732034.1 hypothetical protein [Acetobacteraceae bacterium]MEA2774305.1 hypothetical protein [Acetobacteraceae bacterium]
MRRLASATAIAALLVTAPAHGFDAAGVDIIGLRLGMPGPEVVARLAAQGYAVSDTPQAITATTRDGRLHVALSAGHGVTEISYVFSGRRSGEPAGLRQSIVTRFGNPSQPTPPTWCRAVGPDGMCPKDQASLSFLPDSLTLLLRSEE